MEAKHVKDLMEAYASVYSAQEEVEQLDEVSYSAKAARAGKDIGKPGKTFEKIAKEAGKRYGSEERGEKVAGAVLAKLRKEEVEEIDEAGLPYGPVGKGFKKLPAGKKREAMMKRADKLRTQAMKDDGDGGKGSPRGKMGEINDALRNPRLREETDIFDYILEHLVAEGYADTNKAALAIMVNMSEEWRESIVEGGFNSSGRYDVGGGRTVGPVAGAVRSLFSGNLPKGQTYVPPTRQTGPNRPPAVPASKDDSGKLTDFGAGGGKAKLKTGMSVGQVERQGRMNKGDYSG